MKLAKLILLVVISGCTIKHQRPRVSYPSSTTNSLLQAVSFVDEKTVWVSGHNATFLRSIDGGEVWQVFKHPTADTLQFRDIHAFNDSRVILMSSGKGSRSRIFTFQKDSIWSENFIMQDSAGFLNCLDFWDSKNGIAYGDSFDGYPYILTTTNGGQTWERIARHLLPKAGEGEGGFAASGTCVTTEGDGKAWIATGAGNNCRVLLTNDYGKSWKTVPSPLVKGEAAGNTSISFTGDVGFLTGGDLLKPDVYTENCAFSRNGGRNWELSDQPKTTGAFYCGYITHVGDTYYTFATGPKGMDYSMDLGKTWKTLDTLNYWAVSFYGRTGIAVGKNGNMMKISL